VCFARQQVKLGNFGVNRICKLLGISKTTYTYAVNPTDRFLAKYEHIKHFVELVIKKNSSYGIRRIKAALEQYHNVQIGRDTLAKLLKLWNLDLKRNIKKYKPNMIKSILIALSNRCNLLIRSNINKPLRALTSDISEFKFNNGKSKFFMCVHKDVFGQMVYGYAVSLNMDKQLVIDSFLMAIKVIKGLCIRFKHTLTRKILVHQDQGSQYTSHKYIDTVLKQKSVKFRLSYSTPGTPTENPGQESFFGRFKSEWESEILELETFNRVEEYIKEKIQYYSYERIHTSTKYKTPFVFTRSMLCNM
jgi:putative transposase